MKYWFSIVLMFLLMQDGAYAQIRRPGDDIRIDPNADPDFVAGWMALRQRDYPTATESFKKCAEGKDENKGDANCQYYLAMMYYGMGNKKKGDEWLRAAAENGQPAARMTIDLHDRYR